MSSRRLHRRTLLRGIAGTAIALPILEIMLNSQGTALARSSRALPRRFFVGFVGQSMGADNDPVHNLYVPDTVGPNYDLKEATKHLANHDNIKDAITIVSGLRIPYDMGSGIPTGGWAQDFHIQALGPLISGVRNQASDDYGVHGETADQLVARHVGSETTFDSLQYQVQAAWYLNESAPYGRDRLSYRREGSNVVARPGQVSPRAAFDTLFTGFIPPDDEDAAQKAYELAKRKSVLDLVRRDIDALLPKLGRADTVRMERHLDEIRSLENLLDSIPPDSGPECRLLDDPGEDPPVGGDQSSAGGDDFDVNKGYSDEDGRARVFTDLVHMAYTCDLTRSVALLYTMAQSHMNVHPISQYPWDQHELGHSPEGTFAVSQVLAWHVDHFARLVAKLRDTPEGSGSVLDNCALVLLHEGGHGYDPGAQAENSSHSTENMITLVAGGAGGLVGGHHIVAEGKHPVAVLNTAIAAVGINETLGEVDDTVPALLGR